MYLFVASLIVFYNLLQQDEFDEFDEFEYENILDKL